METRTKIGENGRIVLPSRYRKHLGVHPGDDLLLILGEGEVRMLTPEQAIKNAQSLVRRYVPTKKSLVRDLIEERRREAEHE